MSHHDLAVVDLIRHFGKALKVSDLARITQLDRKTIYKHIQSGKLRSYKIGDSIRLDPNTTADWLKTRMG